MPEKFTDTEVICGAPHQDSASSDDVPADIAELHETAAVWCTIYAPPAL